MTSIIVGFIVLIVAAAFVALQRGLQMRRLVQHGVRVDAVVEQVWQHTGSAGMARHRLRYAFRAGDGREYHRAVLISAGERERVQAGDRVAVFYLADDPKISALAESVEQARKAMKS